ncbi:hypothetical protein [Shinella zoogloeoides]|uniref:hypothetical protein n=1 Tax=Shinella zoogloeoides TaxID=352475 RepID=UPI0028ABFADC|nr:hypothetical protein [Shinella zoogloeoides]
MNSGVFIDRSVFTPNRFQKLAPHLQTEAVLLAVECGNPVNVIAASVDMSSRRMSEIARTRHCYALARAAEADAVSEELRHIARSPLRDRVLCWIQRQAGKDGSIAISTGDIADALCVRNVSVARSIRELVAAGALICISPGRARKAAQYEVTERGQGDAKGMAP